MQLCLATCNASHCDANCKKKLHRVTGPLFYRIYQLLSVIQYRPVSYLNVEDSKYQCVNGSDFSLS